MFILAIVEQVKDGSTVRVRLLMPEGDHQFANIAMAGVRCARVASKPGETSEPWGEEVGSRLPCVLRRGPSVHVYEVMSSGQVLHGDAPAPTTGSCGTLVAPQRDGNSVPSGCKHRACARNNLHRHQCVIAHRRETSSD